MYKICVFMFSRFCGYVFRSAVVAIAVCGGIVYVAITVSYIHTLALTQGLPPNNANIKHVKMYLASQLNLKYYREL